MATGWGTVGVAGFKKNNENDGFTAIYTEKASAFIKAEGERTFLICFK